MRELKAWQAPHLMGLAASEAQQHWLEQAAAFLSLHLEEGTPQSVVGQCLAILLSGLLQSAVCIEEAHQSAERVALIAVHNQRLLDLSELISRHEQGEPVSAPLLEMLRQWLAN